MRTLVDHIVSGDQSHQLRVEVLDEPGSGGANHLYQIDGYDAVENPSRDGDALPRTYTTILFQNGAIKEAGVNGLSHEALLVILIDRLRSFQKGPYPTRETAIALTHLEESLMWLQRRTIERLRRGVEGTTVA